MVVKIISQGNSIVEKPITPNVGKIKVVKKYKKREPSLRAQKAIKILVENGGNKGDALRKAGFSEAVVKTPEKVFGQEPVKDVLNPIVVKMRGIRTKVLDALDKKPFEKQSAYNLVLISSILTKDSELLDGRPTDRTEYELPAEEKARLDKILKMNS